MKRCLGYKLNTSPRLPSHVFHLDAYSYTRSTSCWSTGSLFGVLSCQGDGDEDGWMWFRIWLCSTFTWDDCSHCLRFCSVRELKTGHQHTRNTRRTRPRHTLLGVCSRGCVSLCLLCSLSRGQHRGKTLKGRAKIFEQPEKVSSGAASLLAASLPPVAPSTSTAGPDSPSHETARRRTSVVHRW